MAAERDPVSLPKLGNCGPLEERRVLLRLDLNAPLKPVEGAAAAELRDDSRLRAALPTLHELRAAGAAVLVVSHLGRPRGGVPEPAWSLAPVAARLSELLQAEVPLVADWLDGVHCAPGAVVLAENVRFLPGETENDDDLARRMGALCDLYVNDAFAVCHREHASICGIVKYAPRVCAGLLLQRELRELGQLFRQPARPLVAVVGGAKLHSKLGVLRSILEQADRLLVGGGVAAALVAVAEGGGAGGVQLDDELERTARELLEAGGDRLVLPEDFVCATTPDAPRCRVRKAGELVPEEVALDIGPAAAERFAALVREAGTVVWSGPLGMFEQPRFAAGTRVLVAALEAGSAYSVAGGGDTLAALAEAGQAGAVSFASTGGGAFLAYLRDRTLPALDMLHERVRALRAMERARDL